MTSTERLRARLGATKGAARLQDVDTLLRRHGWARARQRGSHVTYRKAGHGDITFPTVKGRGVRAPYVAIMLERLGYSKDAY